MCDEAGVAVSIHGNLLSVRTASIWLVITLEARPSPPMNYGLAGLRLHSLDTRCVV